MVVGTTIGASVDINGNYSILNLSPGTYSLRVSIIGYTTTQINGVVVSIDLTTTVDVQLEQENVKVGEVVVVAPQSVIKKDVSGRHRKYYSE